MLLSAADDLQHMHSEWAVFQAMQQQIHTHAYIHICTYVAYFKSFKLTLRVGDFGSDPNFVKTLNVFILPWTLAK